MVALGAGCALLAQLCAGTAAAQEEEGAAIPLGGSNLYPALRLGYLVNDNVFATEDDKVTGTAVVLSPSVDWVADRRLLSLTASYDGEYAAYDDEVLDYADHTLSLRGDAELGARRRTSGGIAYRRTHETLGLGFTRNLSTEVDELVTYDLVTADGRFRYGATDALINVEGGAALENRRYTSLEGVTEGRDYTSFAPYALVSFRLFGDARALLETRFTTYDFDNDALDRNDIELLTGLEFVATGALSGVAQAGVRQTNHDIERNDDGETGLTLEADMVYRPVDFVRLTLTGTREIDNQENDANGDPPIETLFRIGYQHDWSARIRTNLFVSRRVEERGCPSDDTTVDSVGLDLVLQTRRWLELGVDVVGLQRADDSDCSGVTEEGQNDFTRLLTGVYVRATL